MGLRSKSWQRLAVLTAAVASAGAVVAAGYTVLKMRQAKFRQELKTVGMEEYKEGLWVPTVNHLGQYLQNSPEDIEVLEAYAVAREKVAEPNNDHLRQLLDAQRRLVALRPDNLEYREKLSHLYVQVNAANALGGQNSEGAAAAEEVIKRLTKNYAKPEDKDPDGALKASIAAIEQKRRDGKESDDDRKALVKPLTDAVREKTVALGMLKKFDEALRELAYLKALDPSSLETCLLEINLRIADRETKEAVEKAAEDWGSQRHAGDPLGETVMADTYAREGEVDKALAAASKALTLPLTEESQVMPLVLVLENVRRIDDARAVLDKGAAQFKSDALQEEQFKRMLYREEYAEAAEAIGNLDLTKRANAAGMRVLALCQMEAKLTADGKKDEAAKVRASAEETMKVLQACGEKWDSLAASWHSVLEIIYFPEHFKEKPGDKQRIDAVADAARRDLSNPFFLMLWGNAHQQSGEADEALFQWKAAMARAPGWAAPVMQSAVMYASSGDPFDGMAFAKEADKIRPNQKDTMALIALCWRAALGAPTVEPATALLDYVTNEVQARYPFEEKTLPLQVSLIAQLKSKSEGEARVREAIGALEAKGGSKSTTALMQLATTCHGMGLNPDLTKACLTAYEKLSGVTLELAFAECRMRIADGDKAAQDAVAQGRADDAAKQTAAAAEDAKKLFTARKEQALAKAGADADAWAVGWCQLLESISDAGRGAAWKELIAAHPKHAGAHWAALNAPSVQGDRSLTGQILNELAGIPGEKELRWHLTQGSWLMGEKDSKEQLTEAVKLLTDTVSRWPGSAPARRLLAQAQELSGNLPAAESELARATDKFSMDMDIRLDLARLLYRENQQAKSVEQLKLVTGSNYASEQQKIQAAALLAQEGELDFAQNVLANSPTQLAKEILPRLYWQKGELEAASTAYKKLLQQKPSRNILEEALQFFAVVRDSDAAAAAMGVLEKSDVAEADRHAIKGAYFATIEKWDDAISELQAAAKGAPGNANTRRRLIAVLLQAGRGEAAVNTALEARSALPDDPACRSLTALGPDAKAILDDADLRGYFVTCVLQPQDSKGINDLSAGLHASDLADAVGFAKRTADLADRNRESAAMQVLATARLLGAKMNEDALAYARRTRAAFPQLPAPAYQEMVALVRLGRWDDALASAKRWESLTMVPSSDAEKVMALSYLNMNRAEDAAKLLEQYQDRMNDPAYREMLLLLVDAQVRTGHADLAEKLLWPAVQKDPSLRAFWAQIAFGMLPKRSADGKVTDITMAREWLTRLTNSLSADDATGRLIAGVAWYRLGTVAGDAMMRESGYAMAQNGLNSGTLAAPAKLAGMMSLGMACDDAKENKRAEDLYLDILREDPKQGVIANNLAMVVMRSGGDLNDAEKWARAALETSDRAEFHDTLASVQRAEKDYKHALESIGAAIAQDGKNPEWRVSRAEILLDAGKRDEAQQELQALQATPGAVGLLNADVKTRYEAAEKKAGLIEG